MAKKQSAPKRGASRYQAPTKKPVPGWIWLACGLVIGGFAVFLLNLEPGRDEIRRAAPEEKAQVTKPTPSGQSKPKFEFYTLLPESEVVVPPEAVPAEKPVDKAEAAKPVSPEEAAKIDTQRAQAALNGETPAPAPPVQTTPAPTDAAKAPLATQFYLQAGSFRRKDDAESVRAQIIMLGQQVRVESGQVRDDTWYRVMVGPFASREQLDVAQRELKGNGFGNLLLQQRQGR